MAHICAIQYLRIYLPWLRVAHIYAVSKTVHSKNNHCTYWINNSGTLQSGAFSAGTHAETPPMRTCVRAHPAHKRKLIRALVRAFGNTHADEHPPTNTYVCTHPLMCTYAHPTHTAHTASTCA